jgi:hypothetical protein
MTAYTPDPEKVLAGTGTVTVTVAPGMPRVIIPMFADDSMSAKAITAFSITSPVEAAGIVDETAHTVTIIVPYGTVVTNMVTSIAHTGASIDPAAGPGANFTTSQTYTVTAVDGTTQVYTVTVTPVGSVGITITGPGDEDMTITSEIGAIILDIDDPLIISRAAGETLTVTIGDTNNDGVRWYVDGVSKGSADSLVIDAADYTAKKYTLLVLVYKDGIPYSRAITFTVTQ